MDVCRNRRDHEQSAAVQDASSSGIDIEAEKKKQQGKKISSQDFKLGRHNHATFNREWEEVIMLFELNCYVFTTVLF